MEKFWAYDVEDVLKEIKSSADGLSSEQVKDRLDDYGENVLGEQRSSSNFMIFVNQFKNPITMILIFAAILSIFLKDYSDGIIILIII